MRGRVVIRPGPLLAAFVACPDKRRGILRRCLIIFGEQARSEPRDLRSVGRFVVGRFVVARLRSRLELELGFASIDNLALRRQRVRLRTSRSFLLLFCVEAVPELGRK